MFWWILASIAALFLAYHFGWRWASRRYKLPCPSTLSWLVEGPVVDWIAGTQRTLERMELAPGMTVVELGPGPGRLLLRVAERIRPGGRVIGVELQPKMIEKLKERLQASGLDNVEILQGDATEKHVDDESADLVYLSTVLGEIPDRTAALERAFAMLRPGGRLSVTEILLDPHYQSPATLRRLAESVGFRSGDQRGSYLSFTMNFQRPAAAAAPPRPPAAPRVVS